MNVIAFALANPVIHRESIDGPISITLEIAEFQNQQHPKRMSVLDLEIYLNRMKNIHNTHAEKQSLFSNFVHVHGHYLLI